jgi:sigma-B regulation protein RsbU (phosphoserine phosphatase)
MQKSRSFFLFIFTLLFITGCKKEEDLKPAVEAAMATFAASLQTDLPTAATVTERVRVYLNGQPTYFFGSTVTLLDANGIATTSPYWYRNNGGLLSKQLAVSNYNIDTQIWLRKPIDLKKPYWTEPYFDAGGGDIWMQTYSVPIIINNKVVAVATTDLAVEKP